MTFDEVVLPKFDEVILPSHANIVPTAGELSTLEAPEGSPQRQDINRSVAGNIFAPPGAFARQPTLSELINASMPRGVQESQRDEGRIPLAPPLPEQGAFEQGGVEGAIMPGVEAASSVASSLTPRTDSWAHIATDLGSFATPAVGSVQELIDAYENAPKDYANARAQMSGSRLSELPFPERLDPVTQAQLMPEDPEKQQALLNAGANVVAQMLMAKGIAHGIAQPEPSHIRTEPLVQEPPPTQSMGPGTTASDVSNALDWTPQSAPVTPFGEAVAKVQPPGPTNLADAIQEQQSRSRDWEQRVEADRQQQNINAMAQRLYNDALQEAKGPGPRDIAAESLLSMQKRVAQITTGDRDVLAAFDRAHQLATQTAEANHGTLLPPDRSTRYIDYTKLPDVAPASAVEATAPQTTAIGEEAPISPDTATTTPGTELVINAPSALPKNKIDNLIPFNIQGNKTNLLANSIGGLVEKAAETSNRTIDAFAGSGTYTHYIRARGLGKSGDILNEFDPLRAITHKQIRDNPAAVGDAVDRYRKELEGMIRVKPGEPWGEWAEGDRKTVSAYFRSKFAQFIKPGQNLAELTRTRAPVEMVDSPDLAGLYTLAQNQAFSFLPIQAELSPRNLGTLRQPGYGVVGKTRGRVQILKNYQPKTMNASAIIDAAGQRFQGLDVRRGDGWKLIREQAGEGDFVPVDTSYLNKGLEKTANYNEATKEDARPEVYLRKVSENLLPAWDRGAKLLITNNYDPVVARQLRELGFQVDTAERSRAVSTSSKELIATNFDHQTGAVYPRGEAVLRNISQGIVRPVERGGGEAISPGGAERLAPRPQSENAAVSGRGPAVTDAGARVAPQAPIPPIRTPLKGVSLYGEPGKTAADVAAAAQPIPVPPQGPVNAPQAPTNGALPQDTGGVPLVAPGDERYANVPQPPPVQTDLPTSGFSTERAQANYGKDAVLITEGKSAKAWKAIGQADPRNPYDVLEQSRARGIATPEDAANLRAEHQRLLDRARQAYGTPEYNDLAQNAVDFLNASKEVVHGPASDVMRGLQEADEPTYMSPADYDNILRERQMQATPDETATFEKVANEVKAKDTEARQTAANGQEAIRKYKPNEVVPFDEASNYIKQEIKKLTEPCPL